MQAPQYKSCTQCAHDSLCLNRRDATIASVMGIILLSVAFVAGYFWGKKETIESANQEIQKVVALNYLFRQAPSASYTTMQPEYQEQESENHLCIAQSQPTSSPIIAEPHPMSDGARSEGQWKAILAGFGSHHTAQTYAQQLQEHNIPVEIIKRQTHHATRKNRYVIWYQVATNACTSQEELDKLITAAQKIKPLNSVKKVKV